MRACTDCLRRTRLLTELSPAIERRFRGNRPAGLLTLDDAALVRTLTTGPARPSPGSDAELLARSAEDQRQHGVVGICRHDPAYPERLRELADPPAVLHVLGGLERWHAVVGASGERPTVAIVGARRAPTAARAVAERFAAALAGAGATVISGLAFGIDAAAHEGALAGGPSSPRGGSTVAVLAGGAERPSPARHRELHGRIAREGVVVSEMPPGATPRRWTFPARNRLIAALADVTVVIAAAARSGSLSTARFALDLDRPVGVVPGALWSAADAGSNRLLRDEPGCSVVLEPADVLALLGDRAPCWSPGMLADPLAGLDGAARMVAAQLLSGPRTVAELTAEHERASVLHGLAELEVQGRLRRMLDGGNALLPVPVGGLWSPASDARPDR